MKVKLKDICEVKNGYAFKSDNYTDSGIRVIRITNVQKGFIEDERPEFYPLSYENELNDYLLYENDLLLSLTGNVGRVALLSREFLPAALNQRVACLRVRENKILNKYLFYYLLSKRFEDDCVKYSKGIAQKNMSTEWLKEYELDILTIDKQNRIIDIFDRLYAIINKYKTQLNSLDTLIKARFVEMFGDVNNNSKKWVVEKLSDICEITRGGSPRPINSYLGGDVPWIKISDASKDDTIYIDSTKEYIIKEGINKSRLVKKGSLIFANCGVSLGFCRIINIDGCIHDGWLAFSNVDKKINKVFLLHTINQLTNYFRSIAPGGTQPNLNTEIMGNYKQIIPPIELQENFINFAEGVDKLKFDVQKSLEKTQMLFDSLMQQFFG